MKTAPILLVEDDPDIQINLERFLAIEGYTVAMAENGEVGMAYLRAGNPASVILLDLMMPVMDGYEFLERFPKEKFRDIPVILLSAANDVEKVGARHGVEVVKKPIAIDRLLELLGRYATRTRPPEK